MERRRSGRQKSLLRGVVYFDNIPFPADCLVRDLSELGARLKFDTPPAALADSFELHVPAKGQKIRGRVGWRKADEIGVSVPADADSQSGPLEDRINRLEAEIAALKQLIKKIQRTHEEKAAVA